MLSYFGPTREANMNFYVVEKEEVKTTLTSYDDIGPEFNFMLKVRGGGGPNRTKIGSSFSVCEFT